MDELLPPTAQGIYEEAAVAVEAVASSLWTELPVLPLLVKGDRRQQEEITIGLFMLLRTVLFDMAASGLILENYLADLGLRTARRREGLWEHPSRG